MADDELEKLAMEELLMEAKRGRERADTMGALAWKKCPVPPANKRFLRNTLLGTLSKGTNERLLRGVVQPSERSRGALVASDCVENVGTLSKSCTGSPSRPSSSLCSSSSACVKRLSNSADERLSSCKRVRKDGEGKKVCGAKNSPVNHVSHHPR